MCQKFSGDVCDWTGPAEQMVVVAMVDPSARGSFQAALRATAKERGFQDSGWLARVGMARECAEQRVAEKTQDGADNEEHLWACIVPGDPAKHAYEVDEYGAVVD
jgi:hypothetical protein